MTFALMPFSVPCSSIRAPNYLFAKLPILKDPPMKDTPEPLTNKEILLIIIVILVVGWGIAVFVNTFFFELFS